jgi:hypothetical protein
MIIKILNLLLIMKNFKLTLLSVSILACVVYFSACSKKDDPAPPNNNNTNTHTPGSTEGTVTIDGTTTSTLQGSVTSGTGYYYVNASNQAPDANNFVDGTPFMTVKFTGKPTKDSIYSINSNNYITVDTADLQPYTDHFTNFSSGNMTVDVTNSQFTVTFTNITLTNSASGSIVASGSVTVY